jgi:D-alanine-D-alanine ligase
MEVTCSVLGNEDAKALPVIEIIPRKGDFFDYESKYTESGSDEIVPARISKKLTKIVQELSINVHKAIGARGFSRVDFILKNNKDPIILEINTIPGLTPMSLLPKAAKAYGLSYSELLDKIIKYSIYE